jgi:hypothetical protein
MQFKIKKKHNSVHFTGLRVGIVKICLKRGIGVMLIANLNITIIIIIKYSIFWKNNNRRVSVIILFYWFYWFCNLNDLNNFSKVKGQKYMKMTRCIETCRSTEDI